MPDGPAAPAMTRAELEDQVAAGAVDTVVLAMTDMQGRLVGKRLSARAFLDSIADHGAEACGYLLAVDVDNATVGGYAHASWEGGYGDMVLRPDLATLRPIPWLERTALCLADVHGHDGAPVTVSPRQLLRRQLDRLVARGWHALAATELEFIVFRDDYEEAWRKGFRDLRPASAYNVDYALQGTARLEPLIGRIRREMEQAGLRVEDSKGECNRGQHEINFRYDEALRACDGHVVYKSGAKEIAEQVGMAITFMAKYDEREGSSCHIHLSLRDGAGAPVFARQPELLDGFLGGLLAALPELCLLLAPNVNSYKRFQPGSFAPTAVAWGRDNRTCALRVVGEGPSLRIECRAPGADANPYLAVAALIAAGLHGIDAGLTPGPALEGNAYAAELPRLPTTLREAHDRFAASALAREALGEEVVAHYLNNARVELEAFEASVTDWERVRGFERL